MTGSDIIQRQIRSFVRREGRLTKGQRHALDTLWPQYGIDFSEQAIDLDTIYNRQAAYVLEIGFGNGESLAQMAQNHPQLNFLGVEVHRPGVGHLLRILKDSVISNVRVVCHDAIEALQTPLRTALFQQISIFFPDPWPKKRHHKRRLIQPEFANLLRSRLTTDGVLHCVTDCDDYSEQIRLTLQALPEIAIADTTAALPRPTTKFEQRGLDRDYTVHELVYKKVKQ